MALRNNRDTISEFGQRILDMMKEKDCETTPVLAKRLLEEKLVKVNSRDGDDLFKKKNNAIGSIERKIRVHIHSKDGGCLQGEFVIAYCRFFGCSADYLFGYTDIKSPNIEIREICDKTGLSEQVVNKMINCEQSEETSYINRGWSQILESGLYYGIINNWQEAGEQAMLFVQKEFEMKKLQEDIKHASGPDILDIRTDFEGVENAYKSAKAAYAGLLFNVSRNTADFIEYSLQPIISAYKEKLNNQKS